MQTLWPNADVNRENAHLLTKWAQRSYTISKFPSTLSVDTYGFEAWQWQVPRI